jgi:radical SAM superfamily enzyme YgiQ (UPF0313 family)
VNTHPAIVLCTLNAKYIHASLGLRYLLANMQDLSAQTLLREFTIARDPHEVVDEIAALGPRIVGLGIYIWNVAASTEVVRLLKRTHPEIKVVLGGPEVSHEVGEQDIAALADYVITGWGDISFYKLCHALLFGPAPLMRVIPGEQPALDQIQLPYAHYTDADLAHRVIYVEASRGCPFRCEFCLSALDKTAWAFDIDRFLDAMDALYQRGARNFKFVDRTFNLKTSSATRILQFFLDRLAPTLFVHFEVIPDHLPAPLKALIALFPPGTLQLEVGVQTFNAQVQQRIARKQDNDKTIENLRWLLTHSHAHVHADLIFGLPGETLESFAAGFDQLVALGPHEIQLGLLKRLRGTPIARHTQDHGMVYDNQAPYSVQCTGVLDRQAVQQFVRLARYWDLIANSGRFPVTLEHLLRGASAYAAFSAWSDWLWASTGKTSGLAPEQLVDALWDYLTSVRGFAPQAAREWLRIDYLASGARANPACLRGALPERAPAAGRAGATRSRRQERHGASGPP